VKRIQSLPLFINLLITLGLGVMASLFTKYEISDWYYALNKPLFNPPNWLFGVAWTLVYILMGFAAYDIWTRRHYTSYFYPTRNLYLMQLALNFLWSIFFFGMHQVLGGAIIITLLLGCIVITITYFNKISAWASWLYLPYLLWISFMCLLNWSIYFLN
jgi:benzodiazapine receptor